tara:strand:+ start:122 stop:556 length:435 start_codon:yes stop_codon:yes gene_type:complete
MDVPGNGDRPSYVEDPHIRIQKWGGNLRTNGIDLESSLIGINRNLGNDCLGKDEFQKFDVASDSVAYPSTKHLCTEESRAIAPAWELRDVEQSHRCYLPLNPQENIFPPFLMNLSTRILEKNHTFNSNPDCLKGIDSIMIRDVV